MRSFFVVFLLSFLVINVFGIQKRDPTSFRVPEEVYESITKNEDHKEERVIITLGLTRRNLDVLESTFWAVSDPRNPDYGRYKTLREVNDLVGPSQTHIDAVTNWLNTNNIQIISTSSSKEYFKVSLSLREMEELFQTNVAIYANKNTGRSFISVHEGYELPEEVSPAISFVSLFNPISIPAEKSAEVAITPMVATKINDMSNADSNAPVIVNIFTEDTGFYLRRFLIYCYDKSYPTFVNTTTNWLTCGNSTANTTITAFNGILKNNVTGTILQQYNFNITFCTYCALDAICSGTSLDQNATLCRTEEIKGIPNYLPWTLTLSVQWSDGHTSDEATSAVLQSAEKSLPSVIFRTYGIPAGTVVTQANNTQGVIELDESFLISDVQDFFEYVGLPDTSHLIQVVNVDNRTFEGPGEGEGILDLDVIMSVAQNAKTFYWLSPNDDNVTYVYEILDAENIPWVFSLSWGGPETIPFIDDPNYQAGFDCEFMKAAVRGITMIVSSGDYGAVAYVYPGYTFPPYAPDFPATSPYVTAVGGTMLQGSSQDPSCYTSNWTYTCSITEVTASTANGALITSGGGFSNLFGRPAYQDAAVSAYLPHITSAQLDAGVNTTGRGYPDVAALSHQFPVFIGGTFTYEDGTSASAPLFAGFITLLNDIRLSQGKPPLGFLNPFLYSLNSSYYNDVTQGNTYCIPDQCTLAGFTAVPGWDAATGLGTPIFPKFAEAVRNLPFNPSTSSTSSTSTTSSSTTYKPPTTSASTSTTTSPSTSTTSEVNSSVASTICVSSLLALLVAFFYLF